MKKLNKISRVKKKVTINETPTEYRVSYDPEVYQPPSKENDLLDFEKIVQSQGMNLDDLLCEEEEKKVETKEPVVFNPDTLVQLLSMAGTSKQDVNINDDDDDEEEEPEPEIQENATSENETAPMSALVDEFLSEQVEGDKAEKKELAFRRSLVDASSASEDERGLKNQKVRGLSSDEELIDTSSKNNPQMSVLDGQAIRQAANYKSNQVRSSGTGGASSRTNGDLIIPYPSVPKEHLVTKTNNQLSDLTPQSLLLKAGSEAQVLPTNPSPPIIPKERPQKIQYRGIWIDNNENKEENTKDTEDEDRFFFNQQREIMKKKLKQNKNKDFGDIDKLAMENVGVEIVGKEKLIKVDRDWGESMESFDTIRKKNYKEDLEA